MFYSMLSGDKFQLAFGALTMFAKFFAMYPASLTATCLLSSSNSDFGIPAAAALLFHFFHKFTYNCTSLSKRKFSGEFCSNIDVNINYFIRSLKYTNSSTPIFCFLEDFLDKYARGFHIFFTTFYNFFFKMIDTYDWMSGKWPIFTIQKMNPLSF